MPGVWDADRGARKVTATLASHILDAIRDHMELHVGFCQWTRDDGVSLWVCSARDNDGQRWVAPSSSRPRNGTIGPELPPIALLASESAPIRGLLPVHWRVGEG